MAATRMNVLADVDLRRWLKDKRALAKSDGGGLTFTMSAAGTASWVLRYRSEGRQVELTLGRYPDVTLAAARKMAVPGGRRCDAKAHGHFAAQS